MIRQLIEVYGIAPHAARALYRNGKILPIIDGLDEVDAETIIPVKGAAIISALNSLTATRPSPVVITCRTSGYSEFIKEDEISSNRQVIQDSTVVQIQPLTSAQIAAYLTYHSPIRETGFHTAQMAESF